MEVMALPGNRIVPFNAEWPAIREAEGGVDQWLRRQWLGERFALVEIEKVFGLAVASDVPDKVTRLLERIVADERSHVTLMEDFLAARGMLAPNRVPLAHGVFEYDLACAVASRAEATCLGTMRVVATDPA